MLCNVYLNRLDRAWEDERRGGAGPLFADDLVVMCRPAKKPSTPSGCSPSILAEMVWSPKRPRPGSCTWRREARDLISSASTTAGCGPGRRRKRQRVFPRPLALGQAMQHVRHRVRQLTARSRLLVPVEQIVAEVNRFLRGWAGYFRYGNSARQFDKIRCIHR